MEAFLARAARERPAALVWETIHVCGDVSACQATPGLSGARQKTVLREWQKRWNLYTELPFAPTGLELD